MPSDSTLVVGAFPSCLISLDDQHQAHHRQNRDNGSKRPLASQPYPRRQKKEHEQAGNPNRQSDKNQAGSRFLLPLRVCHEGLHRTARMLCQDMAGKL
jgi:hypothetical protein